MIDNMHDFLAELKNHGLTPPDSITPGKIERFPGKGKDAKNKAGWALLFPDLRAGVYGDHSSGLEGIWKNRGMGKVSEAERVNFEAIIKAQKEEAAKYEKEKHDKAAESARKLLQGITFAEEHENVHPYLDKKRVKSYGLLWAGHSSQPLLMPLYDHEGGLRSYQTIDANGIKMLHKGGQKKGCSFRIDGNDSKVFITEGYATGASVHEATGHTVIVAVDAGNISHIIDNLDVKKYGQIVIAADNDEGKEFNTGIITAQNIIKKRPDIECVFPPAIDGKSTDWNDYVNVHGLEAGRKLLLNEKVFITINDLPQNNDGKITLAIPSKIYESSELLSLGVQAINDATSVNIIQYILPSVLVHIATAIAKKICIDGNHPSFFITRIGSTSTGKSEVDKNFKSIVSRNFDLTISSKNGGPQRIINTFYGATQFASGAALLTHVASNNDKLIIIDEIKSVFASGLNRRGTIDAHMREKVDAILWLATGAGRVGEEKAYSKETENVALGNFCVNLIGNSTSDIFDSLTQADLESGLLRRFDFFAYDGEIPYRKRPDKNSINILNFGEKLKALRSVIIPKAGQDIRYDDAFDVGLDNEAAEYMESISRALTDESNREIASQKSGVAGLVMTVYAATLRYALIYHAENLDKLWEPLTLNDVQRGHALARLLADWKLTKMISNISSGEFHYHCNEFVAALRACIKSGKPTTLKTMKDRKPVLRNLSDRELSEIEKTLTADETIHIIAKPGGKKSYELLK